MKSKVHLELMGRLPRQQGGRVGYMALRGEHIYLVNKTVGFQAIDVSSPSAPKVAGSYQASDYLGPVAASGDRAYVVEKDKRLRVLDVSDPAQPRAIGVYKCRVDIQGLFAAENRVYLLAGESLQILDTTDPEMVEKVGACRGLELAGDVTVAGNFAYVAADFNGMRVIDVSNPTKPKEVGAFEGPGNVTRIAVAGPRAYLADYSGGLYVVDVSKPAAPRQLGRHGDYVVGDVAVSGDLVLLAAGALEVIDASKPDRPKLVASYSQTDCDTAWAVAAAGDCVYTISDAGLFVFRLRK